MNEVGLLRGYRTTAGDDPEPELSARPPMSLREMVRLTLRTWPYIRPMLRHLLIVGSIGLISVSLGFLAGIVGIDIFNNKVLVGEKLQPVQSHMLFLDHSYVAAGVGGKGGVAEEVAGGQAPMPDALQGATVGGPAVLEHGLSTDQRRTVRNRLVWWGVAGITIAALFGSMLYYYLTWIWQTINQNLRVAMIDRAESLSFRYHNHARVGDAMFRVYQDSAQIVNLIQNGIVMPLFTLYGVVVGLAVVAAFDPLFTLLILLAGVPTVWVMVAVTPRIRRRALANRVANSELTSRTQEAFAVVKVVKANRAERRVLDRFRDDSNAALDAAYFLRLDMVLATTAVVIIGGALFIAAQYIMVGWVAEQRETYLGGLVAAIIGFTVWNYGAFQIAKDRIEGLGGSAEGLLGMWMRVQDLFIGLRRAFYLLDLEPEVVDPEDPVSFPGPVRQVCWRGVEFAYAAGAPILRGVNLAAEPGSITAIVGATGSGKSTLVSLLLRLADPDSGEVCVNDIDLREMALDDIRRNTAIALQKNVLFADTVAANIAFGSESASRDEIVAAAKVATAHEFITALERGYDTELGERGSKLSSGQRQRLSIARAVLRDTPILILDEPTASLDARAEHEVLANLAEWGRAKVIFVITHRLSTVRNADQIVFLEDGQIVESGSHAELIGHVEGRYRQFVDSEKSGAQVQSDE